MDRSQYLQQALQAMQAPQAMMPQAPDVGAMQAQVQQRKAWEAANPGQSYARHALSQMVTGVQAAPGAMLAAPGNLKGLLALGQGAR